MPAKRIPSISVLARMTDPFTDLTILRKRLVAEKSESRCLEWKQSCPSGPSVTRRTKYRILKAILSFANTSGGFVVCGVSPGGKWIGLNEADLACVDAADLAELIEGVVFPDLPILNYTEIDYRGKKFAVIHTPPSDLMPHATTKEIADPRPGGKPEVIIARRAVYYRSGAKSDLASPQAIQKIVANRVDFLKTDLLRRIKEVPIPMPVADAGYAGNTVSGLRVTRLTTDPAAPAVRLTRDKGKASGVFLHEELADGLFDEINNVIQANSLIAKGQNEFFFGEPLYYRIYAERQHVHSDANVYEMLATSAIHHFYAPAMFWLLQLTVENVAKQLAALYHDAKSPKIHTLLRVAPLLGPDFTQWLLEKWEAAVGTQAQPPNWYWTYRKIANRKDTKEPILISMRAKPDSKLAFPGIDPAPTYGDLISAPDTAASLLSQACMMEFEGDHDYRGLPRYLDFLAYGELFRGRADMIAAALKTEIEGNA